MKKLSLILLLTLCYFAANAQKFEGGVATGLNFSQLDGDRLSGYNKVGLNGGLWVSYPFNDKWSAGLEFLYTQKGAVRLTSQDTINSPETFDRYRINYLEIPLFAAYTYKKFTFQGGLTGGVLLKAEVKDFTGIQDFKDQFKPFDNQFLLGAVYSINEKTAIQLRYQYSIRSLAKDDWRTVFVDNAFSRKIVGLYNNLFSFTVKFRIEK